MKKLILVLVLVFGAVVYPPTVSHASYAPDPGEDATVVSQEEAEGEHKDVPWIPIVVLAVLVPIGVLVVPSFFLGSKNETRGSPE